ncbi:MAG: VWA domain-containing protein [Pseudomonadota bacterium]
MFDFYWPWAALLLLAPLLLRLVWPRLQGNRRVYDEGQQVTLMHPSLDRLTEAFGTLQATQPASSRRYSILLSILWLALVLAMMRPQWLEPYSEAKVEGYDLMLAVDASRSMAALDFSVNGREVTRMSVIKGVVGRFITARDGDRVGLVVFGDYAYMLSPLTLDVHAVRALLEGVVPGLVGSATAIGDAIGLAVKKLRERPEGSRVLVLVTDGENTAGSLPPLAAVQLAVSQGIRIYTIGVGSKGLVPFVEDNRRTMVSMEIDEELLRNVASLTDGAYFRATDADALQQIYQQIDGLEKTEAEARSVMIPKPLYRWPLGLAMIAVLLLGLFPEGDRRFLRHSNNYA